MGPGFGGVVHTFIFMSWIIGLLLLYAFKMYITQIITHCIDEVLQTRFKKGTSEKWFRLIIFPYGLKTHTIRFQFFNYVNVWKSSHDECITSSVVCVDMNYNCYVKTSECWYSNAPRLRTWFIWNSFFRSITLKTYSRMH